MKIDINSIITKRGLEIAQYRSILMIMIVNKEAEVVTYSINECILP